MDGRKIACMSAAGFIGVMLVAATTSPALGRSPQETIVVEAGKIDPELQRKVSYRDLNLAMVPDQKVLNKRIFRTASDLCFDLNGWDGTHECRSYAVNSTKPQVAAAIERAQRMAQGLPVGPAVAISMVISSR